MIPEYRGGDDARALVVRIPPALAAKFALLTDPEKILRWMGTEAQVDPQPGGRAISSCDAVEAKMRQQQNGVDRTSFQGNDWPGNVEKTMAIIPICRVMAFNLSIN